MACSHSLSFPWGVAWSILGGAWGPNGPRALIDPYGPPWALMGRAPRPPPGPSCAGPECGPPWAIMGWALVALNVALGPCGPGPRPPGPSWARPLWAPPGPLWARPLWATWALAGRTLVGPKRAWALAALLPESHCPSPCGNPLGPCGSGPYGPVGWAIVGPLGPHGPGPNGSPES